MRTPKLPIGKQVVFKKVKAGYAEGVKRPKRLKDRPETVSFNPPVICITLRKAA